MCFICLKFESNYYLFNLNFIYYEHKVSINTRRCRKKTKAII